MKVVSVSDTHLFHDERNHLVIPDGDILIHAGDGTFRGTEKETIRWLDWMVSLPHSKKVFIAGNHDWMFQTDSERAKILALERGLIYLQDSEVTIEGFRIYGSPWTPEFCNWAFNVKRVDLAEK